MTVAAAAEGGHGWAAVCSSVEGQGANAASRALALNGPFPPRTLEIEALCKFGLKL